MSSLGTGVLGCKDPKTLLLYTLSQHFVTRGYQEHHDIQIEELKFVKSPNGETDIAQLTKGLTKTRKGLERYGLERKTRLSFTKLCS